MFANIENCPGTGNSCNSWRVDFSWTVLTEKFGESLTRQPMKRMANVRLLQEAIARDTCEECRPLVMIALVLRVNCLLSLTAEELRIAVENLVLLGRLLLVRNAKDT